MSDRRREEPSPAFFDRTWALADVLPSNSGTLIGLHDEVEQK